MEVGQAAAHQQRPARRPQTTGSEQLKEGTVLLIGLDPGRRGFDQVVARTVLLLELFIRFSACNASTTTNILVALFAVGRASQLCTQL